MKDTYDLRAVSPYLGYYDRSERERALFTNKVEDLVREPAWCDPARPNPANHDAFQTTILQELL